MKDKYQTERRFYLVQRIYESPRARYEGFGFKNDSNPFGYGRLGNYELDYMGSAEFEWGAIPESLKRFAEAHENNDIMRRELTYNGQKLVFCFIGKDGDPTVDFVRWVEEERCDGKEPAFSFRDKLLEPEKWASKTFFDKKYGRETVAWWSLNDDVMWSFVDEDGTSHLEKMLASMGDTAPQKVRDFSGGKR